MVTVSDLGIQFGGSVLFQHVDLQVGAVKRKILVNHNSSFYIVILNDKN